MRSYMNKYLLLSLILLTGCGKHEKPQKPPPLVIITESELDDVPLYIDAVGHIEALETVNVQSQITGVLEKTHFEKGAAVREGQLLFTIDQRPYIAALEKSEAQLAQNLANLQYAQETARRNEPLVQDDYISQNAFDNLVTNVIVSEALVKENIAEIETAKINLDYCSIYAPLSSLSGDIFIDDGNLVVEGSNTTLVTLNQIAPIYASYYIPEKDLPKVKRYSKGKTLKTLVTLDDPDVKQQEGTLFFIDNTVDRTTGMIMLKSTFTNSEQILWPEQFVKVRLILDTLEDAVLIPAQALQSSQKGKFVYVIGLNQVAEQRPVKLGQRQGNKYVVTEGLKSHEKVVLEGQISVSPGSPVAIKGKK